MLLAFAIISMSLIVVVDSYVASQKSYADTAREGQMVQALTALLEDMTREARLSENFRCALNGVPPCTTVASNIFFMTHIEGLNGQAAGEHVRYRFDSAAGTIARDVNNTGFLPITPPFLTITSFLVTVTDPAATDQVQALVTLEAQHSDGGRKIQLQTSFTERYY